MLIVDIFCLSLSGTSLDALSEHTITFMFTHIQHKHMSIPIIHLHVLTPACTHVYTAGTRRDPVHICVGVHPIHVLSRVLCLLTGSVGP